MISFFNCSFFYLLIKAYLSAIHSVPLLENGSESKSSVQGPINSLDNDIFNQL